MMHKKRRECLEKIGNYLENGIEELDNENLNAEEIMNIKKVSKELVDEAYSQTKEKLKSLGYL
jgi:hypothetical protein